VQVEYAGALLSISRFFGSVFTHTDFLTPFVFLFFSLYFYFSHPFVFLGRSSAQKTPFSNVDLRVNIPLDMGHAKVTKARRLALFYLCFNRKSPLIFPIPRALCFTHFVISTCHQKHLVFESTRNAISHFLSPAAHQINHCR
jgi:hypothetical protein